MKRFATVLCLVTLALLGGCSADDPVAGPVASAAATPAAPPAPSPSSLPSAPAATAPPGPSGSSGPEPTTSLVPFPADTARDTEQPSGGQLDLVSIRVAAQQGYDRVVFEFAGTGRPGWFVGYVDATRSDGSGYPVPVEGQAFLELGISSVDWTKPDRKDPDDPALPAGLGVVRDVVSSVMFEAQYQAFIGTSQQAPFRVFRLADPPRVVVDVRHG